MEGKINQIHPAKITEKSEVVNHKPEYNWQSLKEFASGIKVIEVSPEDPEYDSADTLGVPVIAGQEVGLVEGALLTETQKSFLENSIAMSNSGIMARECWWLEEEWQERLARGDLTEQFTISCLDKKIEVFNFQKQLTEKEQDQIKFGVKRLFEFFGESASELCTTILIRSGSRVTDVLGREKEASGYAPSPKIMVITENGKDYISVSDTISHEFGHLLEPHFPGSFSQRFFKDDKNVQEWLRVSGWERDERGSWTPTKGTYTEYGATNPSEDFAESLKWFLIYPHGLDEARREYFIEHHFDGLALERPVEVNIKRAVGSDINLPRAEGIVRKYKVKLYDAGPGGNQFLEEYGKEKVG